ncbi:MAG: c-type cytochrome, partial [Thiogranum sp.]
LAIVPPQELVEALVLAETNQAGNDISTDKLLDLQAWMRSVTSPAPGDFDEAKAEAGFHLFFGKANCVACHSSPDLTGPGLFSDITEQTPSGGLSGGIHVPSLRGISHTAPYFHDGSAATLTDAVARFVARGGPVPPLSNEEQGSLVEYLNSL